MSTSSFSLFLTELTKISPRRGIGEQQASALIESFLNQSVVPFKTQEFISRIPVFSKAELFADNKSIPCLGASFVGGKIDGQSSIMNSFEANSDNSMIIFNPISLGICQQTFKNVPTLCINRDSVVDLVMAKEISGDLEVEVFEFTSRNFLIGNSINPKKIVFAHYDCLVGSGAVDNAAAVDVLFQTIIEHPNLLSENLFVFVGSEEESISRNEAFYGFEMFDKQYPKLIDNAEKIIILDGVGISTPQYTNDNIDWVFGISRVDSVKHKCLWMFNDQSLVMKYYHTVLDTLDNLDPMYIVKSKELLINEL